mgnify:CR=1 FL=1
MSSATRSLPATSSEFGFDSAEFRAVARRQLEFSTLILACFGLGCALVLVV